MSDKKIRKVCKYCGSEDVLADSYAQWNTEKQEWEIANIFDSGHFCNQCDGDCSIVDVSIEGIPIGKLLNLKTKVNNLMAKSKAEEYIDTGECLDIFNEFLGCFGEEESVEKNC